MLRLFDLLSQLGLIFFRKHNGGNVKATLVIVAMPYCQRWRHLVLNSRMQGLKNTQVKWGPDGKTRLTFALRVNSGTGLRNPATKRQK